MNGSLAGPPLAVWSSRAYPEGIMGPSESWEEGIPPRLQRAPGKTVVIAPVSTTRTQMIEGIEGSTTR